jgi:NAD(P)-dependent dehydrogenase (short-subunit alcohol dehydrogenase family)
MKTAFITGTSSGLGKAAVQLFHSKGWNVIATMRDITKGKEFENVENITLLKLDVSKPEEITRAVAEAVSFGEIDLVINNAADGAIGALEGVSNDEIKKIIDTNLLGPILITQAFIPHFRTKRSGLFINITSMAGFVTFPFASLYHAVKYGLEGWTEGMSYELAPFGIGIKAVAPGSIRTEFGSNMVVTGGEPYQEMMKHYMDVVSKSSSEPGNGSSAEEIAQVVYDAAMDKNDVVHYHAGADSKAIFERRLEIGQEASRLEMGAMFLGTKS